MTQAKNTLTVRNEAQRILFEEELKGQLSDGMWENTVPSNHWQPWCVAVAVVAEPGTSNSRLGRNFYARKDNYDLASPRLLEVVGDRMIKYVQDGTGRTDYDLADLKADLRDLKAIFKLERSATESEKAAGELKAQAAERKAQAAERARKAADARRTAVAERATELVGYVSPYGQYGMLSLSVDQLEKLLNMATPSGAHVVCANFIDFTEAV